MITENNKEDKHKFFNSSESLENELSKKIDTNLFSVTDKNKQNITKYKVEKEEVIYLIPSKPLLSPGQLLGVTDIMDAEDFFGKIMKVTGMMDEDEEDADPEIVFPICKDFSSFFSYKKVMQSTLLVVGERIEIYKKYCYKDIETNSSAEKRTNIFYWANHYIDVIDGTSKNVIETNLFSKDGYNGRIVMKDELDFNLIKRIYTQTNIETIIEPLKILTLRNKL